MQLRRPSGGKWSLRSSKLIKKDNIYIIIIYSIHNLTVTGVILSFGNQLLSSIEKRTLKVVDAEYSFSDCTVND